MVISEIDRSPHDTASVEGDAPTLGPGDLGDQAVSVGAAKGAADLGAFLYGIVPVGLEMTRRCEPCPDVVVIEPSQAMVTGHDGLEQFSVVSCERIETGALPTRGILFGGW